MSHRTNLVTKMGVLCWVGLLLFAVTDASAADTAKAGGSEKDSVFYAGGSDGFRLNCVQPLSDGTILLGGAATSLDSFATTAKKIELQSAHAVSGETKATPILIHLSADAQTALHLAVLPSGSAEEIRHIKVSNVSGDKTAGLFISGKRKGEKEGYFLAKLDGNFVDGVPTKLEWQREFLATGSLGNDQPWDVGSDGKVVYATGTPHGNDWLAVGRLSADGKDDVVPQWRTHWYASAQGTEAEFHGMASEAPGKVSRSAIVLKIGARGDFRSWSKDDYLLKSADGNGGTKQGRWPLDAMFDGYFDPKTEKTVSVTENGRGYYGYRFGNSPCANVGAIAVDRRTGDMYIGGNNKSKLPDGNPDFEPWVAALSRDGELRWWQRFYSEEKGVSTPDQYIDALSVDCHFPKATGSLVVIARSHGNNVNNYWHGSELKTQSGAKSFQNGFTGTNGNMHFSWLGRTSLDTGTMLACTYVAEYSEGTKYGKDRFSQPLLDHWPRFDSGWPDLNTTRMAPTVQTDANGNVYVAGVGRRVVTTKNAYLEMPSPLRDVGAIGSWSNFVRVYSPDLSNVLYSSLMCGPWDWTTGKGGSGVEVRAVSPVKGGLIAIGYAPVDKKTLQPSGSEIPTRNVPSWGKTKREAEMGVIGILRF